MEPPFLLSPVHLIESISLPVQHPDTKEVRRVQPPTLLSLLPQGARNHGSSRAIHVVPQ